MRIKHSSIDLIPNKGTNINLTNKFKRNIGLPVFLLVFKAARFLSKYDVGTKVVISFKEEVQLALIKRKYGYSYAITKNDLFVDQCLEEINSDSLQESVLETLQNIYAT
jgi:hypothetical protein